MVVAERHAPELHDLSADELARFWADGAAVGRTISSLLDPVKLDDLLMGHLCPHLHCHLIPQYAPDDPHGSIDPQAGDVRLDEAEWTKVIEAVRAHLAGHHPTRPTA